MLDEYFRKDEAAFYDVNGIKKMRGVHKYYGDTVRNDKAIEQAKLAPVAISKIISYVSEFFNELVGVDKNIFCESMELDGIKQVILDNCIIATNLNWDECVFDKCTHQYTSWDHKYDVIKEKFSLKNPSDIIWMKFTKKKKLLGVVARGFDINYDDNLSSGVLVNEIGEEWDESFVLIFPLYSELTDKYKCEDLETAVGNYLISKEVPIVDYYSHNN